MVNGWLNSCMPGGVTIKLLPMNDSGASNKNERQSERENKSAEHACRGEAERRVTGNDGIVKRAEADAAACHDRQYKGGQKGQIGVFRSDLLDGLLDLGTTVSLRITASMPMWVLMYAFSYSQPGRHQRQGGMEALPTVVSQEFSNEERCRAAKSALPCSRGVRSSRQP
jgi:hypothetical protein